jgi:hypothetical protein
MNRKIMGVLPIALKLTITRPLFCEILWNGQTLTGILGQPAPPVTHEEATPMRQLIVLALSISLWSAVSPTSRALGSTPAKGKDKGSSDPAATAPKSLADPSDALVANLCHIACGESPCCCHAPCHQGRNLAARLTAIDSIGGFKTFAAVECLRGLLKELCCHCGKDHCCCGDLDRTLLALHAIQALSGMGSVASNALPEINGAACISDDLAAPIGSAITAITAPPQAAKPAPLDPAVKAVLDKIVHQLGEAQEAVHKGDPHRIELLLKKVEKEINKIENPPAAQ